MLRISHTSIDGVKRGQIKDGRYGIYITDGKVNATLPKDLDYKSVDLKQAIELINNKKAKKK